MEKFDRFRIKFGNKEVVASVLGAIAIYLLTLIYRGAASKDAISVLDFFYLPSTFLAVFASIFGVIPSIICGVCGQILKYAYSPEMINYPFVFCFGLYGAIVGRYKKYYKVFEGEFSRNEIIIFNILQMGGAILCRVMMYPLILFYSGAGSINEYLRSSLMEIAGTSVMTAILGTGVLYIISSIRHKKRAEMEIARFKRGL